MTDHKEIGRIAALVKAYMEFERVCGDSEWFSQERKDAAVPDKAPQHKVRLDELAREAARCRECELAKTRRNVVFGSGSPKARLMFIGEAPGEDEDLQGLPFVGRAGTLLTKIIEAMGLKRSDVYIANVLKCRPPANRAPLPAEILACAGYLKRQIEAIRPRVICTLGKFASQSLLKTEEPITKLRGKFRELDGIKVMPTFHPAYLLRNPADKKLVWEDMKKVMKELGS